MRERELRNCETKRKIQKLKNVINTATFFFFSFNAAYNFGFDASTAHAELKVQGETVTWEPQGVKGHDPRLRGKESKSWWGNVIRFYVLKLYLYFCLMQTVRIYRWCRRADGHDLFNAGQHCKYFKLDFTTQRTQTWDRLIMTDLIINWKSKEIRRKLKDQAIHQNN